MSPQKREKVRRTLDEVSKNSQSKWKAAEGNKQSFLYRRWTGKVVPYKVKGQPPVFTESELQQWLSGFVKCLKGVWV